jgi:hypothetical protein
LSCRIILSFIKFLFVSGARANSVTGDLTGVKQTFVMNLKCPNIFEDPRVKQGIKSTKYRNEEIIRIAERKKESDIIPFSIDLLKQLRVEYYQNEIWNNSESLDRKAAYLAVALCFDTGVRISSVTKKDGRNREDHCIRLQHVSVKVRNVVKNVNGRDLASYFTANHWKLSDVILMDFNFFSDKVMVNSGVVLSKGPNTLARNNPSESQLLDDCVKWILYSGVNGEDELFTRYYLNSRKVVTRKQVTDCIQDIGVKNGIPRGRMNTKSLRKGYATSASLNGMSEEMMKSKGAWSSNVGRLHYTRNMNNGGILAMDKQNYGIDEVRRLL